jgi:hypothetical protein
MSPHWKRLRMGSQRRTWTRTKLVEAEGFARGPCPRASVTSVLYHRAVVTLDIPGSS